MANDVPGAPGTGGEWAFRALGLSFLLGALVDGGFGLAILLAQEAAAPVLHVTLPEPRVYIDLCGLFLVALGGLYLLVWRSPRRLAPVAAVAILLRYGGLALFAVDVLLRRADLFFLAIALVDGALATLHLVLLRAAAGGLLPALLRREPVE